DAGTGRKDEATDTTTPGSVLEGAGALALAGAGNAAARQGPRRWADALAPVWDDEPAHSAVLPDPRRGKWYPDDDSAPGDSEPGTDRVGDDPAQTGPRPGRDAE